MKPRSPQLLRIIIKYLGRHRGLVVGILLLGIAQAALLKAPYFLIKDVADLLFEDPAAADTGHANSLFAGFVETKNSILGFLGLTPAIDYPTGDIGLDTRYKRAALIGMSVLLGIMAALGGLTIYAYRVMTSFAATKVIVEMRNDLCGHLLSLSIRFFGRQRTGDLISRVSNDTTTVMRAFNLLFENAVLDPLFLLFNVILASSISPWLGLIVALLIPILSLPMGRFGRKIRRGSGRSLEALGEATDSMEQMFSGFRTVKAFQIEEHEINEFKAVNRRFLRRTMGMLRAKAKGQGVLYLLYMLGFAVGLLGLQQLILEGALGETPGDFMFALAAVGTTYTHVKRATRTFNVAKESQGAFDRIGELLAVESDIEDREGALRIDSLEGAIEFRDVSFAYNHEPVLKGVSFRVAAGEKAALVGPSGSGKSTILDLLTRFYDPVAGLILIDGHELGSLHLSSYLSHLATVDQHPFLFNRSIRENILLGRPGSTEEEMLEAARVAFVDDFARELPKGYDTVVGERGSSLSGGQLQRITIARAVIRNPRILLLDEATSALDSESESVVQRALNNLMENRTSIIIAHRLSTVREVDRIYVIEDGQVVEMGSHEELIVREGGAYRRLSLMQT